MERPNPRERRALNAPRVQHERLMRTIVVGSILVSVGGFALVAAARNPAGADAGADSQQPSGADAARPAVFARSAAAPVASTEPPAATEPAATEDSTVESLPDLAMAPTELTDDCTIAPKTITAESETLDIQCLQQALQVAGFYSGEVSGKLDGATSEAVRALQIERDLYVDGVAGRETGISLGIWPEEKLEVVRTPAPPPGAEDSWGFPLSSVASTGDKAPPLPENSGTGKRVVYERISQRAWAVDGDGEIIRSWLIAGSQYNNEVPGTHYVYSRSEQSTAWNGKAILPYMIRWYQTEIGHIGFHGIPVHVSDGSPYMTEDELGTRLSGGCQRQSNLDARFMWAFAEVGTKVVVL